MRKLTNILALLFSIYEITNAGTLALTPPTKDYLLNSVEQKIIEGNKKRLTDFLIPEIREQGVILNAKAGKITYLSKKDNLLFFLESSLTKTGNYFKINYSKGNLKFNLSTEMNFINIPNMMMRKTSPFVRPQITINSKFSFPLHLPF